MTNQSRISLTGCYKVFDQNKAVRNVSCSFEGPGLVLLLGANGAGKSTLLRLCAGLTSPSAGKVEIAAPVSYFSHLGMLFPNLTVKQNLSFFRAVAGGAAGLEGDVFNLKELETKTVEDLSQGQRARVSLHRCFAANPGTVILLDEPCNFLDAKWRSKINGQIAEKARTELVLLVTHNPAVYIEQACRVVILESGEIRNDINLRLEGQRPDMALTIFQDVVA